MKIKACWSKCLIILGAIFIVNNVNASAPQQAQVLISEIKQIKRCDGLELPVTINTNQPLRLIVHGCNSSAKRFSALAKVYHELDQQTVCFEYNDRDRLDNVAKNLIDAMNSLEQLMNEQSITVIGHSQGGLIARRALSDYHTDNKKVESRNVDLVTISAPFSGIDAASHCGVGWLRIATLGIVDGICFLVTGAKYLDIPAHADFIVEPGNLLATVKTHLIIKTDESQTCRKAYASGNCAEDDYVFSLAEQTNDLVELQANAELVIIRAGHAEIVGDETTAPWKLISLLQSYGYMGQPKLMDKQDFTKIVNNIYQNQSESLRRK